MKHQKYRHCTAHNGKFTFQLSILGHPCRTNEHYETEEDAGVAADLVKHYLRTEFKLVMPDSLDGEQFSSLAYSRHNVLLSDSQSVLKSIPEDVRGFIANHRTELEAYRDAQPEESVFSKFRRSDAYTRQPEIRAWVIAGESALASSSAFSKINSEYFFTLLGALSNRLNDALLPLYRAAKMHSSVTDPLLVARSAKLAELISNLSATAEYVQHLISELKAEELAVASAVAVLESSRPALS